MADPTKYVPGYDFSDYQASNPSSPLPGAQVDIELAEIAQSVDETIDALADIRRSDGALKNGIVTSDSLSQGLKLTTGLGADDLSVIEQVGDNLFYVVEVATNMSDVKSAGTHATTATEKAEIAVAQAAEAASQVGIATARAMEASGARDDAHAQANRAESGANRAENARDASFALGPKYADEASGRNAVSDGDTFLVIGDGLTAAIEYRRIDSNNSLEIARYPAAAAAFNLLPPESGYILAFRDADKRLILGVDLNGNILGKLPSASLAAKAVTEEKLGDVLVRHAVPHLTDVVAVEPDGWRDKPADVAVLTATDGSFWEPLPTSLTPLLSGVNRSGVSLDFRRSSRLPFRGRRACGSFVPGADASNYRGYITVGSAWPPDGSFADGDYYLYADRSGARAIGSETLRIGDTMVRSNGTWVYAAGPVAFGGSAEFEARQPGDWWIATGAGTFDGLVLAAGDRLIYIGFQAASAQGFARWAKGAPGDLFYAGEFFPSGGLPDSPSDGLVYQAAAAGMTGGFTFGIGDLLVREDSTWGHIPGETIKTVADGAYVSLPCVRSASEWEVRRTDKGTTRSPAILKGRAQSAPRRATDDLVLYSDSLFGVSGFGDSVISKVGRAGTVYSFGGGQSREILSMMQYEIARMGDRYHGGLHVLLQGQNNQPLVSTDANAAQIREVALKMRSLLGARDLRALFLSIPGTRRASWDGTRIVVSQYEEPFASTGPLYDLDLWYAAMFPGQWLSLRDVFLAAASSSSLPDPTFPGMTEAQVAATYGIAPWSYFLQADELTDLGLGQGDLVYAGTRDTGTLPTGGADGEYYLRVDGNANQIGGLYVKAAGNWSELAGDRVHFSLAGANVLSSAVADTILSNRW